ncbi:MAG: hypothetical protein P4M13_03600 [Alphaproteobacteria bacterium]|nr:hypothetical protein [Alphaproteobacteria bacterium]
MKRFFQTRLCGTFVVLCALTFGPMSARADIQTIRDSDSSVWGAFGPSFLNYKEPAEAPNLPDSEHGELPSLAAGLGYRGYKDLYFALEGSASFGDANYNGAYYYYPTVPFTGTTHEKIATVDGKIGKGFVLGRGAMLTPYLELGYRYWDRNFGDGDVEDYQNYDTLAGLMLQISPTPRLILSAYGSAGTTFGGQMDASPYTFKLGDSGIYKIGGKVGFDLTRKLEIFTTLDYDHFRYGQSPTAADGSYEPNSATEDTTVRVGLGYHYR